LALAQRQTLGGLGHVLDRVRLATPSATFEVESPRPGSVVCGSATRSATKHHKMSCRRHGDQRTDPSASEGVRCGSIEPFPDPVQVGLVPTPHPLLALEQRRHLDEEECVGPPGDRLDLGRQPLPAAGASRDQVLDRALPLAPSTCRREISSSSPAAFTACSPVVPPSASGPSPPDYEQRAGRAHGYGHAGRSNCCAHYVERAGRLCRRLRTFTVMPARHHDTGPRRVRCGHCQVGGTRPSEPSICMF
jgi:hypothetical protein